MKEGLERTIVGVPFYDGEGPAVLRACLKNIDGCLSKLNMDAQIVVGINGPQVSMGKDPLSYMIDRSEYNADVIFIKTPPGLVNAEKTIGRYALNRGYKRVFLTDADVSRLPRALFNLWEKGNKPLVGANYSTYPIEILTGAGMDLSQQEITFMRIFEADKHPLAREFTFPHRPEKRLKGSLLLVDTKLINMMFGVQSITSDSCMNQLVPNSDRQLVPDAAFMHFARVDITDHIQARLRHFKAAASLGNLETFSRKSLIYSPSMANEIAQKILAKNPEAVEVASDFLLQCALRHQVARICKAIASRKACEFRFPAVPFTTISTAPVASFREANQRITQYLGQVNWESLNSPVTDGKGITNSSQSRTPIELEPFLNSSKDRQVILDHLGLSENDQV